MLLCAIHKVDIVVNIFEFADELTTHRVKINLGLLSGTDVKSVPPLSSVLPFCRYQLKLATGLSKSNLAIAHPLCLRSDGIFIAHVHEVCAVALHVGRRVASRFLLVRETAVGAIFLFRLFGHIELLHDLLAGCRMPDFLLVAVDDEVGRLRCLGSGGKEIVTEFFLCRLIFVRAGHAVETPFQNSR